MMRTLVLSVVIMAAEALVDTTHAGAAEFRLRDEVRTARNIVLLGEMAEIYAADPQEASKLAAIEITPAPAVGAKTVLRLRDVQDLLAFREIDLTKHRFSGAGQVTILRISDGLAKSGSRRANKVNLKLAQRTAADAIVRYLRENVADEAWQVTVELNEEQAQAIAATGDTPSASGGEKPWVGSQQFELIVATGDRNGDSRVCVTAQVALPPSIVVAVHAMPRGAVIRASDIEL